MAGTPPNLSAIAHLCREAMAHDWPVELVLKPSGSVTGRVTRMLQDDATKSEALKAAPNTRSHLRVEIQGRAIDLERIREVRPRL